jgi:hypothetical protein
MSSSAGGIPEKASAGAPPIDMKPLHEIPDAKHRFAEDEPIPSPQETSNFLSYLVWWWMNPLVWKGYRHPLEQKDLFDLASKYKASVLCKRFEEEWAKQVQTSAVSHENARSTANGKPAKGPSLWAAFAAVFGSSYYPIGVFHLVQAVANITSPILLQLITTFVVDSQNSGTAPSAWIGYGIRDVMMVTGDTVADCPARSRALTDMSMLLLYWRSKSLLRCR